MVGQLTLQDAGDSQSVEHHGFDTRVPMEIRRTRRARWHVPSDYARSSEASWTLKTSALKPFREGKTVKPEVTR
eukprot:4658270-Pyramimonas_sp.AAC.1